MTENKPNYEFDAYIKCDGISSVLCDVALWLPKDADDDVRVRLNSPEKLDVIERFMGKSISIESEIYQTNPQFSAKFINVRIKEISQQIDNRQLSRTKIKLLHVDELTIVEKIASQSADEIYFQISKLLYVEPDAWIVPDYLGNRKVEIRKNYSAKNSSGSQFKIEKHYSEYTDISPSKQIVSSQGIVTLVPEGKFNAEKIDSLYKEAKDFSLLLTFAARHQAMILGYEYRASSERVRYFKNPTDRYRASQEEVVKNALIPVEHFETYMNVALEKWQTIDAKIKLAIKDAIYAIHPFNNSGQADYLTMFSAFEAIVNSRKTKINTEILENWTDIKKTFMASIQALSVSAEAKHYFEENIEALIYAEKFEKKAQFVLGDLKIQASDLWPIFGENSMYKIRNNLAHGSRLKLDSVYMIARDQLQLLLERIILTLLGFDYDLSTAGLRLHGMMCRYNLEEIREFQKQIKSNPN